MVQRPELRQLAHTHMLPVADIGADYIFRVPQENQRDTVDRIVKGAELIRALNGIGL